jgi:hypothetical protein
MGYSPALLRSYGRRFTHDAALFIVVPGKEKLQSSREVCNRNQPASPGPAPTR